MKSGLIYRLVYADMWLLALLSFRTFYVLSDGLCFLIYHIVHYRYKAVRNNLRNAFPEKSEVESREIERRLYRYICDCMLEEVKVLHMFFRELCCHMEYDGRGEFLTMIERYGGIALLILYYANLGRIIGMGAIMQKGDMPVQAYKPLYNQYMNAVFKRIHAHFGGHSVSKHFTVCETIKLCRDSRRVAAGMITDQSPNINEAHHWTTFLNQDIGLMDDAEHIARLMNFLVFYRELREQRRRYCRVEFDLITGTPEETADGEVTELFARRLEQTIRRESVYQSWSYKHWKLKREDMMWHG